MLRGRDACSASRPAPFRAVANDGYRRRRVFGATDRCRQDMSEAVLQSDRLDGLAPGPSEARFRDVAEMVSDWIWETGPDLRLTFLSVGGLRLLSKACGSVIGKCWSDLPLTPVY